jgi:hypothetical protein
MHYSRPLYGQAKLLTTTEHFFFKTRELVGVIFGLDVILHRDEFGFWMGFGYAVALLLFCQNTRCCHTLQRPLSWASLVAIRAGWAFACI